MLHLPDFTGRARLKLEMRRTGKEVGFENSAQYAYLQKKIADAGKQPRKLVILPAKPAPRKSKSVLASHAKEEASTGRGRRAETGVFEELTQLDRMN